MQVIHYMIPFGNFASPPYTFQDYNSNLPVLLRGLNSIYDPKSVTQRGSSR
jgi:hypothetical protein